MKLSSRLSGRLPSRQGPGAGLAFSGLLIAVSFVALLVPLAVYHLAQVAAALRLRTAVLLLLGVVGACLVFGALGGLDAFLLGGLVGLAWSPLLVLALYGRARAHPMLPSALVFSIPVLLLIAFALNAPTVADLGALLDARLTEGFKASSPLGGSTPEESARMLEMAKQGLANFHASREYSVLAKAAALGPWQRLLWFVYGDGAPVLFVFAAVSLGNLLLLDVAFTQVERLRAVGCYVRSLGRSAFPAALVEAVGKMRGLREEALPAAIDAPPPPPSDTGVQGSGAEAVASKAPVSPGELSILSHAKEPELVAGGPLWKRLVQPVSRRGVVRLWGFQFVVAPGGRRWELKHFALPLPVALGAVAFLVALGLFLGPPPDPLEALAGARWLPVWGAGAVLAFGLVTIVAFQGALVAYMRLAPAALFTFLFVFLVLASVGSLPPLLMLAFFGAIGLLDYVHDLRGRSSGGQGVFLRTKA